MVAQGHSVMAKDFGALLGSFSAQSGSHSTTTSMPHSLTNDYLEIDDSSFVAVDLATNRDSLVIDEDLFQLPGLEAE
jgi:hypothetical protein